MRRELFLRFYGQEFDAEQRERIRVEKAMLEVTDLAEGWAAREDLQEIPPVLGEVGVDRVADVEGEGEHADDGRD